jgi:hypothetical protein
LVVLFLLPFVFLKNLNHLNLALGVTNPKVGLVAQTEVEAVGLEVVEAQTVVPKVVMVPEVLAVL